MGPPMPGHDVHEPARREGASGLPHAGAGVFVEGKRPNYQRLWRAIIGENGGGAGRCVGAFATGDRAEVDKTAVARATPIGRF